MAQGKRTQAKQWTPASLESYSEKAIDKARGLERDAAMIVAGNHNEEEDFAALVAEGVGEGRARDAGAHDDDVPLRSRRGEK